MSISLQVSFACNAVVRDPSVAIPIRVPTVVTPVAPSTEYLCMRYNANSLILRLTLTLTLTDPVTPYFMCPLVSK